MYYIKFDSKLGIATPDGFAEEVARQLQENQWIPHETLLANIYCTSSHLVIYWARYLYREKLVIIYDNEVIYCDKDGRLPRWPVGFCDEFDKVLDLILEVRQ